MATNESHAVVNSAGTSLNLHGETNMTAALARQSGPKALSSKDGYLEIYPDLDPRWAMKTLPVMQKAEPLGGIHPTSTISVDVLINRDSRGVELAKMMEKDAKRDQEIMERDAEIQSRLSAQNWTTDTASYSMLPSFSPDYHTATRIDGFYPPIPMSDNAYSEAVPNEFNGQRAGSQYRRTGTGNRIINSTSSFIGSIHHTYGNTHSTEEARALTFIPQRYPYVGIDAVDNSQNEHSDWALPQPIPTQPLTMHEHGRGSSYVRCPPTSYVASTFDAHSSSRIGPPPINNPQSQAGSSGGVPQGTPTGPRTWRARGPTSRRGRRPGRGRGHAHRNQPSPQTSESTTPSAFAAGQDFLQDPPHGSPKSDTSGRGANP